MMDIVDPMLAPVYFARMETVPAGQLVRWDDEAELAFLRRLQDNVGSERLAGGVFAKQRDLTCSR